MVQWLARGPFKPLDTTVKKGLIENKGLTFLNISTRISLFLACFSPLEHKRWSNVMVFKSGPLKCPDTPRRVLHERGERGPAEALCSWFG
jgi:hypothetical protein